MLRRAEKSFALQHSRCQPAPGFTQAAPRPKVKSIPNSIHTVHSHCSFSSHAIFGNRKIIAIDHHGYHRKSPFLWPNSPSLKMAFVWRSSREVWPYRLQPGLSAVGSTVLTPAIAVTNVSAIGYIRCFAAAFPSKQSWEKTQGDMDHIGSYGSYMIPSGYDVHSSPWYRWP